MAKAQKQVDDTVSVLHKQIEDLKELLEYQDKVLGTADRLMKSKDYLIEILELQKEVYTTENKILRVICLSLAALGFVIAAVKIISFIFNH